MLPLVNAQYDVVVVCPFNNSYFGKGKRCKVLTHMRLCFNIYKIRAHQYRI